jgi:hypothetical protein
MKSITRVITLSLLVGCVPSVFPIYGEDDLIFDPAFVGVWTTEDSSAIFIVTEGTGRMPHLSYEVEFIDEECDRGKLNMQLASIGGSKFLDVYPVERDDEGLLLPTHVFFRIDEQVGSTTTLRTMNPDWLKQYLEGDPEAIEHIEVSDEIVLTATTPELQRFYLEHRQTPDAFGEPDVYRHLTDEAAQRLTGHFFLSQCPGAFR